MFYLVVQTSFILLITAALFFALGCGFYYLLQKHKQKPVFANMADLGSKEDEETFTHSLITEMPVKQEELTPSPKDPLADDEEDMDLETLTPPTVDPGELETLRNAVRHLQDQLVDKERVIEELSRAMPAPAAPRETEPSSEEREPDVHLMSKIPQMEAALETQGALLESKSLALEKAKAQLDRERERAALLEQKLLLQESEANELRASQAQSLWNTAAPEAKPASDEAKETELAMLRAERDHLLQEISQLQAANEDLREKTSSQAADEGASELWQNKTHGLEKELEDKRRIEKSLRDEIDSLRHQIGKQQQRAQGTQMIDPQIMERLARAEAAASEKREAAREREKELEEKYLGRIQELEKTVDSFTWEKEELAKVRGQLQTFQRALEAVQAEKEELARGADRTKELERTIEALEAEKHGLERFSRRAEELERELDMARTSKEELETALEESKRDAEELEANAAKIPELERTIGKLRWEAQTHAEEAARLPELERKIEEMREEVKAGERHALRVGELETEVSRWQEQVAEANGRMADLEREVEQLRESVRAGERHAERVIELQRELEQARATAPRTVDLEERIAKLLGEKQKAEVAIAHLSLLPSRLESANARARELEAKIEELENTLRWQKQESDRAWQEGGEERVAEHREKMEELENTVQWLRHENERAWQSTPPPATPAQSDFQKTQAEFQRLVSEFPSQLEPQRDSREPGMELTRLREELLRKEGERASRESVRLEAIQRKLDQIEHELLGMEHLLKRDGGGENELVSAIWRVETMLKEQERQLLRGVIHPARERELQHQVTRLEQELVEKERLLERLSTEGVRDHQAERELHHQIEAMQALVAERERLISTLKKQLQDLSHKVSPELVGDDNLQLITGVGPYTKKVLKEEFGITTFKQVACLSADQIQHISDRLYFKGRIQREDWLGQAVALHFKKYNEMVEITDPPYPMKWAG